MYKITQMKDNAGNLVSKYSVSCYIFDKSSHFNIELWQANNIDQSLLAELLQLPKGNQLDSEDVYVILNSGNGPVILTEGPEPLSLPVKVPVKLKEDERVRSTVPEVKGVLQGKKSPRVSNSKGRGH